MSGACPKCHQPSGGIHLVGCPVPQILVHDDTEPREVSATPLEFKVDVQVQGECINQLRHMLNYYVSIMCERKVIDDLKALVERLEVARGELPCPRT